MASRVSALEATVNTAGTGLVARTATLETATANLATGKADASSLAATNATVTSLGTTVSAQGARLTTAEADLAGKASASSVSSLTARVGTAEGAITSLNTQMGDRIYQIGVISSDVTSLQTATANLASGKANASDVTALSAVVAAQDLSIIAQGGRITTVEAALPGKASASELSTLATRVTTAEGVNTAQNTRLNTVESDVAGKASASALSSLTARVGTAEGAITSLTTQMGDRIYQISLITADVTSLQTATANLVTGKANASDLTSLATRVTSTESVNTAQNSRLNTVESDVAGKASATSLTSLTARVVATEGGIGSLNTQMGDRIFQITSLQADVTTLTTATANLATGKADASRVATLEATVNTAGTGLTARLTTVETVTANNATRLAEARLVIMAEASGGRPAIFGLYSDSRGTSAISLNAARIYFGDNTTFDDATDTIQTVWSGARKVMAWGAPFGPDSLTEWEGADGISLSSMTKANARFWRSPVAPYFGSVALSGPFTVSVPAVIVRTVVGGSGTITTAALATSTSGATGAVSWTWTNSFGDPDVSVGGTSTPTFSANPVGVSRKQAIFAYSAADSGTGITRYGQVAVTIQREA